MSHSDNFYDDDTVIEVVFFSLRIISIINFSHVITDRPLLWLI